MSSPFSLLLGLLSLASLLAPSSECCCDCCCGGGDSTNALLMALLGGTNNLSLGRRKRATTTPLAQAKSSGQQEKPMAPKFRFGKDDPTPLLMGWPVHSVTQLKPAKDSISEWYRRAFAEEKDKQRAQARAKSRAQVASNKKQLRRQRRLAAVMNEAIQRAVRLRRQRQQEATEEALKMVGAAKNNKNQTIVATKSGEANDGGH